MNDELILNIGGTRFRGFKTVAVERSFEAGPWQFELSAAAGQDREGFYDISDGMPCQIFVDDDMVLTGFVDDVDVDYDDVKHDISIRGRSSIGDLVDCSTAGVQIKAGQSLVDTAISICEPYGITVTVHDSARDAASEPFTNDNTQDAGQSPWEFLETLARIKAVWLTSNQGGGLTITRAGSNRTHTALQLGKNIKASKGQRSSRSLFSEYNVIGQQALFDADAATNSQSMAKLVVKDSPRYRPCLVQPTSPVDKAACTAMAEWQRRINWGRSQSISYTVKGWRQENTKLWVPNELVNITDKRNQLANADRLISTTRMLLTEKGRTTEMIVMPKEAFDLQPMQESSNEMGFNR